MDIYWDISTDADSIKYLSDFVNEQVRDALKHYTSDMRLQIRSGRYGPPFIVAFVTDDDDGTAIEKHFSFSSLIEFLDLDDGIMYFDDLSEMIAVAEEFRKIVKTLDKRVAQAIDANKEETRERWKPSTP